MSDLNIDTSAPVLVTGATGYVAGRLVERLLQQGLTVHATVRDPSKTDRLAYLNALAEANPGTLQFFAADLMTPGAFADAMQGCQVVFHVASPFANAVEDPQRDLVDPAVKGTANVLEQANEVETVKRVVVTSSCAAIYGSNRDLEATPNGEFTEEIWNTSSTLERGPYFLSKTLAEKKAWEIHDAQERWSLVTINPCMVLGPGVKIHPSSESFHMVKSFGDGQLSSGMPDLGIGVVDVREVAEAHLRGGFLPDASGRYILAAHGTSYPEMAAALRPRFGDRFPIPTRVLPKWLLWLVGPWVSDALTRQFISDNVGLPWKANNTRSREELGITYRSLEETMGDFFQQLIDEGVLGPKG